MLQQDHERLEATLADFQAQVDEANRRSAAAAELAREAAAAAERARARADDAEAEAVATALIAAYVESGNVINGELAQLISLLTKGEPPADPADPNEDNIANDGANAAKLTSETDKAVGEENEDANHVADGRSENLPADGGEATESAKDLGRIDASGTQGAR